jgi:capsular exopolysaccharide synthesis family protein
MALVVPASVPVLPFEEQEGEAAEQYRIARTKIAHHPKRPRIIAVTSPSTGDGKTVSAINLAGALSLKAAAKILLADVDFRRSSVHGLLGLPHSPGLAEVLAGGCPLEEAVVETEEYPNLNVLTSGEPKANPSELLDSPRWHAFCDAVKARYEYVIFDAPPVGSVADCDLIQLAADGVLIVLRPDHTKRGSCLKAFESVPKEKLIGVLLNCTKSWPLARHGRYGYGYGYGAVNSQNGRPDGKPKRAGG